MEGEMMGRRIIFILAILAIIVWVLQFTSLAFLPKDAADFAGGLAAGLSIGAVVSWVVTRSPQ
jgi:hypothetical protein